MVARRHHPPPEKVTRSVITQSRNLTIGIFGHYGNENMGDEAIVAAVKEEILSRYPDARVFGFSIVPEDTRRRHGIAAFPIRRLSAAAKISPSNAAAQSASTDPTVLTGIRQKAKRLPVLYPVAKAIIASILIIRNCIAELGFLWSSYRVLKQVDLLLVSGSGQLIDQSGTWGFPYTMYKWSVLASWSECRLAFIGVGAGPLSKPLARWFVKHALRRAGYRSYRDESSYQLVNTLGIGKSDSVCPDLAFGKFVATPEPIPPDRKKLTVGINPMAYQDPRYWPNASATKCQEYLDKLARIISWIASQGDSVVLFPTQLRADTLVIRELLPVLDKMCQPSERSRITAVQIDGLESQLAAMATFDLIIATRFHGVLMSYLVGKPTIGISYHRKIHDLMAYMGHPECAHPIDPLDVDAVERTYILLKARLRDSQEIILARCEAQKKALTAMYDEMFAATLQ
jgi:polysaccharide pyruvyl transferase WcaK-like protein